MLLAHFNRREFLQRASLIAMAPTVPAFLSRTVRATQPDNDGRILVEPDGGPVAPPDRLPGAHDDRAHHVALLHRGVGDGALHGTHDDVPHPHQPSASRRTLMRVGVSDSGSIAMTLEICR